MKIIDFAKKGNVVRFYLGEDNLKEYYGDDWDDKPYEHNAGKVYEEYISGHVDIAFPFDWLVMEPSEDWTYSSNSPFSKEDFVKRQAPCIVVVPTFTEGYDDNYYLGYSYWVCSDNALKFYFGDTDKQLRNLSCAEELSYTWTL